MIEVTGQQLVVTCFGYDDAGNLTWSATGLPWSPLAPCGYTREHAFVVPRRVDRTYDARNRLATLAFPDGQGDQIWTYTPDGLPSQVIAYNDPNHTGAVVTAYQYNKRRLLNGQGETISQPSWYSWGIGYGYDANGNLASHAYPSGYTVAYQPNALGQATKAGTFATNVSYYPNGGIQQFTYGNGLVHTLTQNARQLPLTSTDSGGVLSHQYTYDGNGNVAQILDLARGSDYHRSMTYDGRDRLTGTGSCSFGAVTCWFHYDYDVLDNLTRVQGADGSDRYYCYDTRWQLTNIKTGSCAGASVVGLGYDERGNLANKNGQAYLFDYGNRLRLVSGLEYYRYDGLGRRAYASSPMLGEIFSQYSRDGQLMYQHNGRTQKSSEYIYLNGSLVAQRETPFVGGTSTVKYQHTDALGTPVAVTDSTGSVIERSEYTPYGKLFNRPLTDGPGYTGHVQDAATGLTYMQQRYYDPGIGRMLSMDPVTAYSSGDMRHFNGYAYAYNNPYRFTDPDGRCPICAIAGRMAIGAAAGAGSEVAMQMLIDGKSFDEIDRSDVAVSAGIGAVLPGMGSVLTRSRVAAPAIKQSVNAIKTIAGKARNTANRAAKLAQQEKKNIGKISQAAGDVAETAGLATLGVVLKRIGQEAANQMTQPPPPPPPPPQSPQQPSPPPPPDREKKNVP